MPTRSLSYAISGASTGCAELHIRLSTADQVALGDTTYHAALTLSTDPPAGTPVSEDTTITICSKKQGE